MTCILGHSTCVVLRTVNLSFSATHSPTTPAHFTPTLLTVASPQNCFPRHPLAHQQRGWGRVVGPLWCPNPITTALPLPKAFSRLPRRPNQTKIKNEYVFFSTKTIQTCIKSSVRHFSFVGATTPKSPPHIVVHLRFVLVFRTRSKLEGYWTFHYAQRVEWGCNVVPTIHLRAHQLRILKDQPMCHVSSNNGNTPQAIPPISKPEISDPPPQSCACTSILSPPYLTIPHLPLSPPSACWPLTPPLAPLLAHPQRGGVLCGGGKGLSWQRGPPPSSTSTTSARPTDSHGRFEHPWLMVWSHFEQATSLSLALQDQGSHGAGAKGRAEGSGVGRHRQRTWREGTGAQWSRQVRALSGMGTGANGRTGPGHTGVWGRGRQGCVPRGRITLCPRCDCCAGPCENRGITVPNQWNSAMDPPCPSRGAWERMAATGPERGRSAHWPKAGGGGIEGLQRGGWGV